MPSSADRSLHSDDLPVVDPTPTEYATDAPVVDPTPTAIAASNTVPKTSPLSGTFAIVEVLNDLGFNLSSVGGRQSADGQINVLRIGPLRRLAAWFGMLPDPTIERFQLRIYFLKQLCDLGMIAQEDLDFFFAPALAALPDECAVGSNSWRTYAHSTCRAYACRNVSTNRRLAAPTFGGAGLGR